MCNEQFKDIEPIGGYRLRFKCCTQANDSDGHQATFHIYKKNNEEIHFKINFEISGTEYNSNMDDLEKSREDYIDEKYGSLKKCFKEAGYK